MKRGIRQHGKGIALTHDHGRYQAKVNDLWAITLNTSNAWEPLSSREPKRLNRAGSALFRPKQHQALTDPAEGQGFWGRAFPDQVQGNDTRGQLLRRGER
jgi:hypothetical protein